MKRVLNRKIILLSLMLAQSPVAHADWWTYVSSPGSYVWKNYKSAIIFSSGLLASVAIIFGYKKYKELSTTQKVGATALNQNNQPSTIYRKGPFASNGSFSIKNLTGNIIIKGIDSNTINIRAVKTATCAAALRNTQVEFRDTNQRIFTRHKKEYESCACTSGNFNHSNGRRSHTSCVDYTIELPRTAKITATNHTGSMQISGCNTIKVTNNNGSVQVTDCDTVNAQSCNGNVEISRSREVNAQTSNGSIRVNHCNSIEADTSTGNIVVTDTPIIEGIRTCPGEIMVDGKKQCNGYHQWLA